MSKTLNRTLGLTLGAAVFLGASVPAAGAAPVLTTLVSFDGTNGSLPQASLVFDMAGNLYGTTGMGGLPNPMGGTFGTIFQLSGAGHTILTTILKFDGTNGATPLSALTVDAMGQLYGTSSAGGSANVGNVFHLSGANHHTLHVLTNFAGPNGSTPESPLISDAAGNLYGTTYIGGTSGYGTVYELSGTARKHLVLLHSFDGPNGAFDVSPLVADAAGNLFGTTFQGGTDNVGMAFELSGVGHKIFTILASFNGVDGGYPEAGLAFDAAGNLYGTTSDMALHNGGTIYELSGPGHTTVTTLFSFGRGHHSGAGSIGGLLIDAAGNLYGTTQSQGSYGAGTVFKVSSDHQTFTVLHEFKGGADGYEPLVRLTADATGNLYGTTLAGGTSNQGTVFELSGTGFVNKN